MFKLWWMLTWTSSVGLAQDAEAAAVRTVESAKATHAPMPPMPAAEHWRDQTRVICHMNLDIRPDGTVQRAIAAGCPGTFRDQAVQTARTWTFEPVTDALKIPIRSTYAFDLTFRRSDRPVRTRPGQQPIDPILPEAPSLLRWALGVELSCASVLKVDEDGAVEDIDTDACPPMIDTSIRTAALQWRFPTLEDADGMATASLYPVTVTFRSTDLVEDALSVDIPGLMSIPLAKAWTDPLPPPPPGVEHLDDPLPESSFGTTRSTGPSPDFWHELEQLGLQKVRMSVTLLVTVNKRGRVTDTEYLEGPDELRSLSTQMVRARRFDRSSLTSTAPVRFVLHQTVNLGAP